MSSPRAPWSALRSMCLRSLSYESVLSLDEWKRSSQNSYGYELEAQWQRKHVIWSMLIPREVQVINPKKKENNHEARTYGFGSHLEAILGSSWGIWDVFGGHFERLGANLSQQDGLLWSNAPRGPANKWLILIADLRCSISLAPIH